MSFQPSGMLVPTAFTKSTGKFFQRQKDRLCTVISWDMMDKGILVVREDDTQHLIHAHVAQKDIDRARAREQANSNPVPQKWSGYAVDTRMRDNLPVNTKVVLERCMTQKKTTVGKEECRLVECSWVVHVTDPSPTKVFSGLFSVSAYQNNIQRIQHWNDSAFSMEDEKALTEIANDLDSNYDAFVRGEMRPSLGVQFRVIMPKELEEGKTEADRVWEVIDSSPPFDWTSAVKDANNVMVTPAHPINGDKFAELVNGYRDYIEGDVAAEQSAKFSPEMMAQAKIEVMTYMSFMASTMSKSMTIPDRDFDPLFKLARTPTRYAQDDAEPVMGKNMGVFGILLLSSDKADPIAKTWVTRDLATRLFANGYLDNIQNCVKTHLGNRARVHPSMAAPKIEKAESSSPVAAPVAAPSASVAAPQRVLAPVAAPVASTQGLGEFDPFATDADPFLTIMKTPAAVPAEAVAAEVPAQPVVAAAAAKPASRFGGRNTAS